MLERRTKNNYKKSGVTELIPIKLGSFNQWILIRGENVNNPILLFLHGGPGTANIGIAADTQRQLEKRFIVVNWDQLGAGLSYDKTIPKEEMTINKMVEYTYELMRYLLQRFNKNKLFLVGHSWGSILGILTASKYPELIEKYVGVSQCVGGTISEEHAYQYCLKQAMDYKNEKAIKQLKNIGLPPYKDWMKGLQIRSAWSNKYGAAIRKGSVAKVYLMRLLKGKEYKLSDLNKFMAGFTLSLIAIWPEIMEMDLLKEVGSLSIPSYFFLGRNDYQAPSILAEDYISNLKAEQKEIVWFENSAHMCNIEEEDKFTSTLERVLIG